MAGTLTNFTGAISFGFLTGDRFSTPNSIRSTSNLHILNHNRNRNHISSKASLHSVIGERFVESMRQSMKQMSLYDVLNVKTNATASEIKSAYRSLAKTYHPDASGLNRNDDRDFIDINNAYVTLSDPTSRALYDLKLSGGFQRRRSGGLYAGTGKMAGVYAGRRWETDQCW